jgi:hypothetical protein
MTTGEVVGGIFFAADKLFRVEELTVSTGSNFINDGRFKIYKDGAWNMLSGTGFAEKGVESIISSTDGFVTWHLAIRLKKNNTDIDQNEI